MSAIDWLFATLLGLSLIGVAVSYWMCRRARQRTIKLLKELHDGLLDGSITMPHWTHGETK